MAPHAIPAGHARERGIILVAVLWVVTVIALLVVSLGRDVRSNVDLARIEIDRLRSRAILDSAVDVAVARLLATKNDVNFAANGQVEQLVLGRTRIELRMLDAQALLDVGKADPDFLRATLDSILGPGANSVTLADSILKRRSDAAAKSGAELPFQTIAEIYELSSESPQLVDKLMPFIGLYSKAGRINVKASPIILIESVPGISASDADQIATLRKSYASDAAYGGIMARYGKFLTTASGSIYRIEAKVVGGEDFVTGSKVSVTVALDWDSSDTPYQVVSVSW